MKLLTLPAVLLFLLFAPAAHSQMEFSGEANLLGLYSSQEDLPFWLYHNKRGRVSKETNVSGWITGKGVYELDAFSFFEVGAGVLFHDGFEDAIVPDELYGHFENRRVYLTIGKKHRKELYRGVSASDRSILWSVNAPALPGIQIGTNGPLFPFDPENNSGFGFEGSYNEYLLGTDRYVKHASLHHKNFFFVYKTENDLQIKAGLQHFVQWGGNSPQWGPQPSSARDYLRIITGQSGRENATVNDQMNTLGNQIGGYELNIRKGFEGFMDFSVELLYQHLFEDGSGQRMVNFPDGRYGIYFETEDREHIINAIIYEFYYTKEQSQTTLGVHKYDDYFVSGIYRSGWTYQQMVLGAPFFTVNPVRNSLVGIINNSFTMHHVGIGGEFGDFFVSYPYKVMLTYGNNYGRYHGPYEPKQEVGYFYSELGVLRKGIDLDVQLGAEFNSVKSPIFGVGVQLSKKF